MKLDLYGILGLHRDASMAQIKAAYRKMAKKAHPDQDGGSKEQFALVCLARDILSDDERRSRYDSTGDAEEESPDALFNNAMEYAFVTTRSVVMEAEKQGLGHEFDLIGDSIKTLKNQLETIRQTELQYENTARDIEGFAKRFRAKKGQKNLLKEMWLQEAARARRAITEAGANREKIELAITILSDQDYDWNRPQERSQEYQIAALPAFFQT